MADLLARDALSAFDADSIPALADTFRELGEVAVLTDNGNFRVQVTAFGTVLPTAGRSGIDASPDECLRLAHVLVAAALVARERQEAGL